VWMVMPIPTRAHEAAQYARGRPPEDVWPEWSGCDECADILQPDVMASPS
jgi:hypothetical protein